MEKAKTDKRLLVVNAATPGVVGFSKEDRKVLGSSFVDVGIAEEHAVAVVSGAAKGKLKPVMCVLSSFLQRTFDQLMQDLALNKTPATILVYGGGLSGADETHVGSFDVVMTSAVPNLTCLAPASKTEYLGALEWAINQTETPVVIRVPDEETSENGTAFNPSDILGYKTQKVGEKVAVFALGTMLNTALKAYEILKEKGVEITVVSVSQYSEIDEKFIGVLAKSHDLFITLENGVVNGGFGEKLARKLAFYGVKVICRGGEKEFTDRESLQSQRDRYRLNPTDLASDVLEFLGKKN
jgi:1-deoxy-D-xylulose-5-phosphate synthase